MTDYIKREDAIRAMAKYVMDMALIDNPEASDRIEEWEGSIAAPVMSTVKAADIVEVVRCKDCKNGSYCEDVLWCDRTDEPVREDDFCSYGEGESK